MVIFWGEKENGEGRLGRLMGFLFFLVLLGVMYIKRKWFFLW